MAVPIEQVSADPQASQTLLKLRESQNNKSIEKEISQLVSGMDLLAMGVSNYSQNMMMIDEQEENKNELSFEILLSEDET